MSRERECRWCAKVEEERRRIVEDERRHRAAVGVRHRWAAAQSPYLVLREQVL